MQLSQNDKQILRDNALFQGLEEVDYSYLFDNVKVKEFNAQVKIINEGDTANSMFVIVKGSLEVYIDKTSGERVILAILGPDELVGEDGLNPKSERRRTADVQTIEHSRVIEIPAYILSHLIPKYSHVTEQLTLRSTIHSYDRMFKLSSLLQNIKLTPEEHIYIKEINYKKDDIIFSIGDVGDAIYLIVSGKVRIVKPEGQKIKILGYFSQGQYFGEIAILQDSKRSATIIAEKDTKLLRVDKELFLKWHSSNSLFRQLIHSLKNIYRMEDESLITTHTGKYEGKECISTLRRQPNGETFCSIKLINEETSVFYKIGMSDQKIKKVTFISIEKDIKRELHLNNNKKLVGVVASGPSWLNLGEIISEIIAGTHLFDWQLEMFQQRGEIQLENANDLINNHTIICKCVNLSYGKLCDAINIAGNNQEKIINVTGATLTCGSCKKILDELFGKTSYIDVAIKSITEINENIFSIVIESLNDALPSFIPGQFINLQILYEGKWLQRSYTITAQLSERAWEIIIQRQLYGLMSNLLTGKNHYQTILRASLPHGTFTVTSPLNRTIFFAAGIGITPALAMLRAKIPGFYLFYCEPTDKHNIYKQELETYDNVIFYYSRCSGHLTSEKIVTIMRDFEDANVMVCGPKGFMKVVSESLKFLNIAENKIKIESFIIEDVKLQQQKEVNLSHLLKPIFYQNENDELERFLDSIYAEFNLLNVYQNRLNQIREEIKTTHTFRPTAEEINIFIKKVLLKQQINLNNVYILDRRNIKSDDKISIDHNYYVTNNLSNIVITIIDREIQIKNIKTINITITKYCQLKAIVSSPAYISIDSIEYKYDQIQWVDPIVVREGKHNIPGIGIIFFIWDFIKDPLNMILRSRIKFGKIFSFRIPFSLNIAYLGKDSYNTLLEMPTNIAKLGGVLMLLPAVGFWYKRSRIRDENWLQELIISSTQFIASELTCAENLKNMWQIVNKQFEENSKEWGDQINLSINFVKLIHDASFASIMKERFPDEVRQTVVPLFRQIINGIDVPRASLATTPFYKNMPEFIATKKVERYFDHLIAEHHKTNKYPFLDKIAAIQVDGKQIPASDVSWVLMYILWNIFAYPGTYGVWCLIEMLKSEKIIADLNNLEGEERNNFLYSCYIETIRSHPPASLVRKTACPMSYEANQKMYLIKKDTLLGVTPTDFCFDPENYETPLEYNPYRYMHGEKFPDLFGKGPFSCPAVQFTKNIITMTIDVVLKRYELKLIPPFPTALCRPHLIYPKKPVLASCLTKN